MIDPRGDKWRRQGATMQEQTRMLTHLLAAVLHPAQRCPRVARCLRSAGRDAGPSKRSRGRGHHHSAAPASISPRFLLEQQLYESVSQHGRVQLGNNANTRATLLATARGRTRSACQHALSLRLLSDTLTCGLPPQGRRWLLLRCSSGKFLVTGVRGVDVSFKIMEPICIV